MTALFATLAGLPVAHARVFVSATGPWFADVDLHTDDPTPGGVLTLQLGELALRGTVAGRFAGTFGLRRRLRLVAGAGGWGTLLEPKSYHNDGGVQARAVAIDAARAAGEQLGGFAPSAARIGHDYVRQAGPASRALEDVIGDAGWWVDYAGVTQVGARSSSPAAAGSYEVLEHDARSRLIVLGVDDLGAVQVDSVLSAHLDEPQTVRELELVIDDGQVRVRAWCGQDSTGRGRLAGVLERIVGRVTDERLFGLWKYRVVRAAPGDPSNRLELQAMSLRAGLPNVLPVSMRPGVAGVHADLAPGAEVLVEFVEGDRRQPVVTHFAGRDGGGWTPVALTLDVATLLKLGAGAADFVALATLVGGQLSALKTAISAATTVSAADFKASLLAALDLTAWPASVAATKVQAQ